MDQRDVAAIPLFAGLSKEDQKVIAQYADDVDVSAGTKLAQEGRFAYEFFAIKEGTAQVTREGAPIAELGPGDFFGEIGLLRDVPRTATVVAAEDTVLLVLARDDFLAAVTGQSDAFRAADDVVSYRLSV